LYLFRNQKFLTTWSASEITNAWVSLGSANIGHNIFRRTVPDLTDEKTPPSSTARESILPLYRNPKNNSGRSKDRPELFRPCNSKTSGNHPHIHPVVTQLKTASPKNYRPALA
jgi:hypothetical protein